MLRVLLWGMGKEYNTNINSIKYFETTNQFEVIGVISSENYSFRQLVQERKKLLQKQPRLVRNYRTPAMNWESTTERTLY